MDATTLRARPENITLDHTPVQTDLKSFTATHPASNEFETTVRTTSSASYKTDSLLQSSPTKINNENQFNEQIANIKENNTLLQEKLRSPVGTQNSENILQNQEKAHSTELNDKITALTKELDDGVRLIAQKEQEINDLKVTLRENLEKIQTQDRDLTQEREKSTGLENSLKETCERLSENLRQREQEVETLKSTVAQLKEEHANSIAQIRAEEDNKARQTEESIRRLEERITGLEGELAGQARNGEIIHEKEREIEDLRRQVEEKGREIEQLREQNRNFEQQVKDSTAQMEDTIRRTQERHDTERAELNEVISKLEREIQDYKDVKGRLEAFETEKEELVRRQKTLEEELAQAHRNFNETSSSSQQNFEELRGKFEHAQQELERERQTNQQLISEKTQEVERLQGELKRIVDEKLAETQEKVKLIEERDALRTSLEQKSSEVGAIISQKEDAIRNLTTEIDNKMRELNEQRSELEQLRAKCDQLSHESGSSQSVLDEKQNRINTLEEEVRCLNQQLEESRKDFQQIHEAKVLINEFAGKKDFSSEEQLVSVVRHLIEECRRSHEAVKEESIKVKDLHEEMERHKTTASQGTEELTTQIRRLETEKGDIHRSLEEVRGQHEAHKNEMSEKVRVLEEQTQDMDLIKQGFVEKIDSLEREKDDLTKTLEDTTTLLDKTRTEFETMKGELTQTIHRLETENRSVAARVQEKENLLQASMSRDTEFNELKGEHNKMLNTISTLDEEKVKLQEKVSDYAEKLELAMKEIAELKAQTQKGADAGETKKVTILVEEPRRDSREAPFEGRRASYWRNEVVYRPKDAPREAEEEDAPKRRSHSRGPRYEANKENKEVSRPFDWVREKKAREEDPAYKQLQKMVTDLNEKLLNTEKRAKKIIEERVFEASKDHLVREETLMGEIQKLKDEKKELLKKIDDIQWNKAYEFTELMKVQKQEEAKAIEAALKQKQAQPVSTKNKKKAK